MHPRSFNGLPARDTLTPARCQDRSALDKVHVAYPASISAKASQDVSRITLFEGAPIAVFDGRPHGPADDDVEGALRVPTAPEPGAALGAVKDKPSALLRASLTAPARDASSAPQGRDEETAARPNKETARAGPVIAAGAIQAGRRVLSGG